MNAYLKDGRLQDVLALIQVLAREKWAKRTEPGIVETLQRPPQSHLTWLAVSQEHPELFRLVERDVDDDPEVMDKTALIMRLLQPKLPPEVADEPERLAPLSFEETGKLLELAITLHDTAVQRKDRWKTVGIPIAASVISASAVLISAFLVFKKPSGLPSAINVTPTFVMPEQRAVSVPVQEPVKVLPAPSQPVRKP